jgi:hypothetical protein
MCMCMYIYKQIVETKKTYLLVLVVVRTLVRLELVDPRVAFLAEIACAAPCAPEKLVWHR